MARMNLHGVPDEVYAALVKGAEENRRPLNAFVVERLAEVANVVNMADYVASYTPPVGTGVTVDDAVAAVREVRDAS
ncbi:hypothetical protein [Haloactinomyces albus]|uniref:Uncharacterized protein n=1 Tax=Haloactinomyces albus TaxID=1352928 RepID=A0AAE3ZGQ6_9ACTN|nr:hypothetical protein [Haloactinomyces albus]MDR7302887.1 hypothetical protein [Haloactinomyces albus]